MRRSGKVFAQAGAVLAVTFGVLCVTATTAWAQPEASAEVVVGQPDPAECPPLSFGDATAFFGTVNGVTVQGQASCSPAAADSQGVYSIVGFTPFLNFNSSCASVGNTVTTDGEVVVPAGTSIGGGAPIAAPQTVTTENTPVVFPGGRTATLNVVTTNPDGSVTRDAIVFDGGPIVGRVTCDAEYPLSVEPSVGGATPLGSPASDDGGSGGLLSNNLVLIGGGLALVVLLAQIAIARRIRGN